MRTGYVELGHFSTVTAARSASMLLERAGIAAVVYDASLSSLDVYGMDRPRVEVPASDLARARKLLEGPWPCPRCGADAVKRRLERPARPRGLRLIAWFFAASTPHLVCGACGDRRPVPGADDDVGEGG